MRPLLDMPLLAVGAAFDYHAGMLRKPPPWMQRPGWSGCGGWAWSPRRLWRRYLLLNPALPGPRCRPQKTEAVARRPTRTRHRTPDDLRRLSRVFSPDSAASGDVRGPTDLGEVGPGDVVAAGPGHAGRVRVGRR